MKKLKKSITVLFVVRLLFYLSVTGLVAMHPGIIVSYDRIGIFLWFVIIPLETIIAFIPAPGGKLWAKLILAFFPLVMIPFWVGGFGYETKLLMGAGALSFVLSFLLFYYPRWGKLSVLEPFFLAAVCLRLLNFSRAGEDAAGISMEITPFILVWTLIVFLFHSAIIYFCLHPNSISGIRKEGGIGFLAGSAALIILVFVLPADFVQNAVVPNLLSNPADRMIGESSEWGVPEWETDGRRDARSTLPRGQRGRNPGLRGLSPSDWPGGQGRTGSQPGDGDGAPLQYAVMIVASEVEPVYMGNSFRGRFDPVEGFLPTQGEILNLIPAQRLFSTWFYNVRPYGRRRARQELFSLSILSQRYLPYRPFAVDPTILSEDSGPFRYIHRVISDMHNGDPLSLVRSPVRELRAAERANLSFYLELPLNEDDRLVFSAYLDGVMENWQNNRESLIQRNPYLRNVFQEALWTVTSEYMERIVALLVNFSQYQYNLNPRNNVSVSEMREFLLYTREGDCVEFSNSLALLGRLAGIPSRVVTGYLVAESLQTMAHLRGLAVLQNQIPVLQSFPSRNLFLVTNLHGHSWVQFFIPEYGWLDFEATAFAIPPEGTGDFNTWDVVIPILDETRLFSQIRIFPWRPVLRFLGFTLVLVLIGAYFLRYGRELVLQLGTRRGGREGARYFYLLLLARLAAEGKPIKPASKTVTEYSALFPDTGEVFAPFAALYAELRWRELKTDEEREEKYNNLKQEFEAILSSERRRGLLAFLRRIFSLRGLAYL